jgi:hypothetical protein
LLEPLVGTSAIEFGVMNILTGFPDLSLAWTRKEFGMTFTLVKPDSCKFLVTCCESPEAIACAFAHAFAAKLNVGPAKVIAAAVAAVSVAAAINGVLFIAGFSWKFSALWKPAEHRLVPEKRQINENSWK